MIKKTRIALYVAFSILFCTMFLFAGSPVAFTSIPKVSQDFVKKYFAKQEVRYVERDNFKFEVKFIDGMEITFNSSGEWQEVDGNRMVIPTAFIPKVIMDAVKKEAPNARITKIEIDNDFKMHYEVKLDNRMELDIAENGAVLRVEFDN